jgi:hypothetical protein
MKCKCGAVYDRMEQEVSFRDKDFFKCFVCGHELERWDGFRIPMFRLINGPNETT